MKRFCLSIALAILLWPLAAGAVSLEKVRAGTPVKLNPIYNLPMMAAEEKEIWQKNGLQAQWVTFSAAAAEVQAVAAGALDFGMLTTAAAIQSTVRGVPLLVVADMQATMAYLIWVRADSPLKEPKDLKGVKIGTARFGGVTHTYGLVVLKALGVEKEARWIATGGTRESLAALKIGTIDATLWSWFTGLPFKAKGEIRELLVVHDYLPRPWSDQCLLASRDMIKKGPAALKKTVRTFFQAAGFVMDNRDWTLDKLQKVFGYTPEAARLAFSSLRYGKDGKIDKAAIENIRNFLIQYEIIPREKTPPAEELYTAEFTG